MTDEPLPTIAVLGASGLIGQAAASQLLRNGFPVVAIARRFVPSQKTAFGKAALERLIVSLDSAALSQILAENKIDIVVNCIGVLQDGNRGGTDAVHRGFVERLVAILASPGRPSLLIHLSIPGNSDNDRTAFSRTKREAERVIAAASIPFIILRPGFVIAPAAYGGSALVRALAALRASSPRARLGSLSRRRT
jgi:uncharacterized protein YbjT (DUF2867 family)